MAFNGTLLDNSGISILCRNDAKSTYQKFQNILNYMFIKDCLSDINTLTNLVYRDLFPPCLYSIKNMLFFDLNFG
jgi:hypothetical protein